MQELLFQGIGTHWKILYFISDNSNGADFGKKVSVRVKAVVERFDAEYSRFREDSMVHQLYREGKGEYEISDEFLNILSFGKRLQDISGGRFNPAVGKTLESLGYDASYSFIEQDEIVSAPAWELEGNRLILKEPTLFDIGGFGKGYLVDLVAKELKSLGVKYFLVDGGGDVYGTQKPDGHAWKVALEHPNDPKQAIGTIEIKERALAGSGTLRRSFGKHHHILDAKKSEAVDGVLSVFTTASFTAVADGAATTLFICGKERGDLISTSLKADYLLIFSNTAYEKSDGFDAKMF